MTNLEIINKMYQNNKERAIKRLEEFFEDELKFLAQSHNGDFLYSNYDFGKKVYEILGKDFDKLKKDSQEYQKVLGYKIIAQTDNFVRTTQPIAVLAGVSALRGVNFNPKEFMYKNDNEKLQLAKKYIEKHFLKYKGSLPVFGEITRYICYFDNQIIIDTKDLNERLQKNS